MKQTAPRPRWHLVFAMLPALVLFATAEWLAAGRTVVVARFFNAPGSTPGTTQRVYEKRIGWPFWGTYGRVPLNSYGCGDDAYPPPAADAACARVLFLGDSMTFGDGVNTGERFTDHLKNDPTLNAHGCTRIYNCAKPGWTITGETRELKTLAPILNPDLVIVGVYENDLADTVGLQVDGSPNPQIVAEAAFLPALTTVLAESWHEIHYHFSDYIFTNEYSMFVKPGFDAQRLMAERRYAEGFAGLMTAAAAHNTRVAVLWLPSMSQALGAPVPEEAIVRRIAEAHDVRFVSASGQFSRRATLYPFLAYDGHYNRRGHGLVAQAVRDWLAEGRPDPDTAAYLNDVRKSRR
jgi:hypothetical protein